MSTNTYKIAAGKRAYSTVMGKNVDVVRVYKTTATVRTWGEGVSEGKLVTYRAWAVADLSAPAKRLTRECECCGGTGVEVVSCESCGEALTDKNVAPEDDQLCTVCFEKEEQA